MVCVFCFTASTRSSIIIWGRPWTLGVEKLDRYVYTFVFARLVEWCDRLPNQQCTTVFEWPSDNAYVSTHVGKHYGNGNRANQGRELVWNCTYRKETKATRHLKVGLCYQKGRVQVILSTREQSQKTAMEVFDQMSAPVITISFKGLIKCVFAILGIGERESTQLQWEC